jgi:predicted PurR-regulated permease PerM
VFVVALLIGIVTAGIVDALTNSARRRRANGFTFVALVIGLAIAIGGWMLVKAIDETLDVYYFVGFLPTLLAGDYLSKKVTESLQRRGVTRR